jgi:hypothetical protein
MFPPRLISSWTKKRPAGAVRLRSTLFEPARPVLGDRVQNVWPFFGRPRGEARTPRSMVPQAVLPHVVGRASVDT